jgi:hypothetical protein
MREGFWEKARMPSEGGAWLSSSQIQSRTLRVQLPNMLSANGGQQSDCISRPFGHIRLEDSQTPPTTRSSETAQGPETIQQPWKAQGSQAQ